jgi:formamidopyrimidine-DNA glycosylase
MPELPEVETVRRLMRDALQGKTIRRVEVAEDEIVLGGTPAAALRETLDGSRVLDIGRRGKFWWLHLEEGPCVFGHLGMSGWIRRIGGPETRIREHGSAPIWDEEGRPRFLKLLLEADDGASVAFTDGRRLGRLWMGESPAADSRVAALGPDALEEMPCPTAFHGRMVRRKSPVKAVLMDQAFLAGLGNWTVDEVLFQSGISPKRPATDVSTEEAARLRGVILDVLTEAVAVEADSDRFPKDWLFHFRWGGSRGADTIHGHAIVRETVGGRTTAWVPDLQS